MPRKTNAESPLMIGFVMRLTRPSRSTNINSKKSRSWCCLKRQRAAVQLEQAAVEHAVKVGNLRQQKMEAVLAAEDAVRDNDSTASATIRNTPLRDGISIENCRSP